MTTSLNNKSAADMWIISKGRFSNVDLNSILGVQVKVPVMEYDLSDFGQYMLNPNPVCIKKRLVGCKVDFILPFSVKIKEKIKKILPEKWQGILKDNAISHELLISDREIDVSCVKDRNLSLYFDKIDNCLLPFDVTIRSLSRLDSAMISDITGICEDFGGNRSFLKITGDIKDKIDYIKSFLYKDVSVVLERAYLSKGLFEMRGYDFQSFDQSKSYKILKVFVNGKTKCCVFNSCNKIEYWFDNIQLFYFMHMLQYSFLKDIKFKNALDMCIQGHALPLRIFFNKQFLIDYSEENLPETYKDIFKSFPMESEAKAVVVDSLKHLQYSIAFNCVAKSDLGKENMVTSVSVMHNFKALEPIKKILPNLYSNMNKKTCVSEAGKYYLLDSISGCQKHE